MRLTGKGAGRRDLPTPFPPSPSPKSAPSPRSASSSSPSRFTMRSTSSPGYGAFHGGKAAAPAPVATSCPPAAGPTPPPASRGAALLSRFRDQGWAIIASQRPWGQLLDTSALSRPSSASETFTRVRRNIGYFRSNYLVSLLGVLALGLTWQPGALFAGLILAAAWFYLYLAREGPLVLFERRFEERTILGALCLATFVALIATNLGSDVFMSLAVGLLLVGLHAAFRTTDDLYLDEREAVSNGLIAGLSVAARPTHVVRVV